VLSRPRVGAEGKADEPRGHCNRRSGTRTAGYVARIEGIARHAIRRAGADQSGGKLVEVGFADQHGAGRKQFPHNGGGFGWGIGESRTRDGRRQTGDIDIVLNGERDAKERQALDQIGICSWSGVEFTCPLPQRGIARSGIHRAGSSHFAMRVSTRSISRLPKARR